MLDYRVILHIPHSSKIIPLHILPSLIISETALEKELIRMTDSFSDILFPTSWPFTDRIVFPVSRLVVDPERFLDDTREPMWKKGMGVIYTKTSDGLPLRNPMSDRERATLISAYYRPHHDMLARAVNMVLSRNCTCLLIDCHSFPSCPLPYEDGPLQDRPDICLGTDPYHTPKCLYNALHALFQEYGLMVAHNHPFSGTLVPLAHYHNTRAVWSIMIEVNRKLYMNEVTGERNQHFGSTQNILHTVLHDLMIKIEKMTPH